MGYDRKNPLAVELIDPATGLPYVAGSGGGGGGGGTVSATATAANPTYAEGASGALSLDLTGQLRTRTVLYDNSGNVIDFTSGAWGAPAGGVTSVQGDPTMRPLVVNSVARAISNGATSSRVVSAAAAFSANLKNGAGNVVNIDLFNNAAYDVFVKFFNKASAPTLGTDTPVWTIPLKAGTGYARTFNLGKYFATGISVGITKLVADADTTALAAGDVTGVIDIV